MPTVTCTLTVQILDDGNWNFAYIAADGVTMTLGRWALPLSNLTMLAIQNATTAIPTTTERAQEMERAQEAATRRPSSPRPPFRRAGARPRTGSTRCSSYPTATGPPRRPGTARTDTRQEPSPRRPARRTGRPCQRPVKHSSPPSPRVPRCPWPPSARSRQPRVLILDQPESGSARVSAVPISTGPESWIWSRSARARDEPVRTPRPTKFDARARSGCRMTRMAVSSRIGSAPIARRRRGSWTGSSANADSIA